MEYQAQVGYQVWVQTQVRTEVRESISQLAGYPPPYHHPIPHFNPNPNPNSSFDYHHHSSLHSVASLPPADGPPAPVEPSYPCGLYPSQATALGAGGDYNAGNGGVVSYYHDHIRNANAGFEAYGVNPVGFPNSAGNDLPTNIAPQFVATNYNHNLGTPQKIQHQIKSSSRKISKKTKTPQSVRCDVCKIRCDTEELLKKHRLGRKHKQNLEKLKALVAAQGNDLPTNIAPPQFVATNCNHILGTPQKIQHQIKSSSRKISKKTKIPQFIRCDVCRIRCDTEEVLKKHRLGRRHKQNLEKLKALVAGQVSSAAVISATLAPEALDISAQTKKKKKASGKADDDMETKKKKVLEGGAAMDAVRTCSICQVVCNSETVFQYHLAGQKHAAMVKKQAMTPTS